MNLRNPSPKNFVRLKRALFLACLLPLFRLLAGTAFDTLGANPVETVTRTTGYWTLTLLLITLAVTPLRHLSGWLWPVRVRRMLGLFAFFYGCLHFGTYLVLDQFFDWRAILDDIAKRPYITVGFAAFLGLAPLAITSTDKMIRRLGGKRWRRLHRLVYAIAIAGVVHYAWLLKQDLTPSLIDAGILALLLGFRVVHAAWRGISERPVIPVPPAGGLGKCVDGDSGFSVRACSHIPGLSLSARRLRSPAASPPAGIGSPGPSSKVPGCPRRAGAPAPVRRIRKVPPAGQA